MTKFVVHDTADVIIRHKTSGKVVLNAEMQLASISGTISEEDLRGGIGNRKLYKIRTDKDINLNVRSAFGDMEYWAMTQGAEVDATGTATVTKAIKTEVAEEPSVGVKKWSAETIYTIGDLVKPTVENGFVYEVTVDGETDTLEPVWGTTADGTTTETTVAYKAIKLKNQLNVTEVPSSITEVIVDHNGTQETLPIASGVVTLPTSSTLNEGDSVTVFWSEEITGRKISIKADEFADKYEVEYRTISYNPDTHEVYSNIYFLFPNCIPVGEFEISLENGSVYTPEIGFSVMTGINDSLYGEIIEELV